MSEKEKIQGNQPVELSEEEMALSIALDEHFENHNCCGVLALYFATPVGCGCHDCCFACKKCGESILVRDL